MYLIYPALSVLPDFYTVSSDAGPASDVQWNTMGKFQRSTDEKNGQPVWVNHDGSETLFYASGKIND